MLIPYLMKVSLVLAVLTLAYRWLIQFETFSKINRVLLWLNVAAAWTLPLISLPSWGPVEVQNEFHNNIPKVMGRLPVLAEPIATIQSGSFQASAATAIPGMTVADWISACYLAGVLIMAIYFLFQITRLFVVVAKNRIEHFTNGTTIVHVPGSSPYSFFKWIILDTAKHSEFELRNILAHEAEHARQWHSADLLLAEIQRICLWFNPFAWIHQKLVQENLEYLADRAVLDNGFEKKQYQYNLLNAVLRTRELPLTNSFAQSLLKKRVKMMNRKPSHYLVWVKYVAVIALVYISSAFVAPYREQIVELSPEVIRPLVKPLLGEVIVANPMTSDSVQAAKTKPELIEATTELKSTMEVSDTVLAASEAKPKVKGLLIRNDTLYWAITPLMNWDDINAIRDAVHKFGAELAVNKIQYDPLQEFITSLSILTRSSSNGSSGSGSRQGDDEFSPTHGYSGYILEKGIGMGQLPPAPLINELNADYEKAIGIKKKNEVAYFEYKLIKGLEGSKSISTYPKKVISERLFELEGIGRSMENTLKVANRVDNSEFYLNTMPTNRAELNTLPIEKVKSISVIEEKSGKKHFIVFTE